jgi:hypothetical protein
MFGRGKSGPAHDGRAQTFGGRRFLCPPLVTTRVDSQSRIVHVQRSGAVGVIENDLLALTEGLQAWGTFDEHLLRLDSAGISLTGHELAGALERLQRLEALWFDDDFLYTLTSAPPRQAVPISSMVWCTRERPHVLARSLESFLSTCLPDVSPPRIIVCDDSCDSAAAEQTRGALLSAAPKSAIPPERRLYIGSAEKGRIIATLQKRGASQGIAADVVEFIFSNRSRLPASEGANRNFALLLTAGEAFHSTDDDTLAFAAYGEDPTGLELSSTFNPTVTDFFAGEEQCSAVVVHERNLLSEHGQYLGRGVGDIVREREGADVRLSSCSPAFSRDLAGGKGSVVVSSAGALGDSGFRNPRMLFHLDGERRERYVEDAEAYAAIRLSRLVFRRAERPVITNSPWLLTLNYAMDNRELVPPTFPFGRNSDGLMGILLRFCRPDDCIVHLPFGVRHLPPEPRAFAEADMHAFVPRMCDFMIHAVEAALADPFVRAPAGRCAALAAHFRAFGRMSARDFEDATRSVWMRFADRYISNMEARLEAYAHSPEPWVTDVELHIESILEFLRIEAPLIPREFAAAMPGVHIDAQMKLLRESVGLFGDALDAWPTLRELAMKEPLFTAAAS